MDNKETIKRTFPVTGMSCASCAAHIDKVLNKLPGVISAYVNYATSTTTIEYCPEECNEDILEHAVAGAGYSIITSSEENGTSDTEDIHGKRYKDLKKRTVWAMAFALPIILLSMSFMDSMLINYIVWILSTPVIFIFGKDFYRNAWRQLQHRTSNMDTLVACSTGIAYLFSFFSLFFPEFWTDRGIHPHVYFEASSVIIAFVLLGRTLEERAKNRAASAIKSLMGLQPKYVSIITSEGIEKIIPIEKISIGQIIMVKPGERIAVDGIVTKGNSFVDESMLSGEPLPIKKTEGSSVYSGTINQKGSFTFKAEKVGNDTTLAHIIRYVQEAQGSKAPVQKHVDRIAAVFVPTILTIALITFMVWMIMVPNASGLAHGLLAAITVLIIACPCALGLATPTAIMAGIGRGAENGILIKDAESLETSYKADTIILDKTGTITKGKPQVTDQLWLSDRDEDKYILYNLEKLSEHPLADAVTKSLPDSSFNIYNFESITGKGIKGYADETLYLAGNSKLMDEYNIAIPSYLSKKANELMSEAKTVVWFSNEKEILALLAINDPIKESSKQAISQLLEIGKEVCMLTGDNIATATAIARQVGIRHFQAGLLPTQKAEFIKRLQHDGKCVAMVGDGINDSAALAQADLSIAMGQGSDIAMEVAQMTIISSDLSKIYEAVKLSEATVKTIRQNLFWAFIYNIIGIPIAAGILYPLNGFMLNPMIAGAAMAFSSVSVVTNSLRLKAKKIIMNSDNKHIINEKNMKKEYRIEGMMCNHCRMSVEKALNRIEGVKATVTLDPPVAVIEYEYGEKNLQELQTALDEGGYRISEK